MQVRITGVVQGVGFRPFVYRVAVEHGIGGWVRNDGDGVHVRAEGTAEALERFLAELRADPPPAAHIASFASSPAAPQGLATFEIRTSEAHEHPTVRVSPDLPVCEACLRELNDPRDRRFAYPYINCTNCGPRYSIVVELPYDRPRTTMRDWPLCAQCQREYDDPRDRRFHAQPVACAACGPSYVLEYGGERSTGLEALKETARLLRDGAIVAIKGIGGYHLASDARNAASVQALRERKYRKERPFALMVRDMATARTMIDVDDVTEHALTGIERPIVLGPARVVLEGIAPANAELGVMLPYAPLHHLLFAAGAPDVLVMTSANRSSEPIAYTDDDARASLSAIADAFLIGERPIARRVDDSVVRNGPRGLTVLRRSRGFAPGAVTTFPDGPPILALGGDLKNAVTLVVDRQAFVSQHIGDLEHLSTRQSFEAAIRDLCAMYAVSFDRLTIAHDLHPSYYSTEFARALPIHAMAFQHHRAHVASVLAERGAWEERVLGVAFDGTGFGDDGTIWGGEVFAGSLLDGFERVAHLRGVPLAGGDAAARFPVQAAAGFLDAFADEIDFTRSPFSFPERFPQARALVRRGIRTFTTSSVGRLFDTVAALAGFIREQTFEGQAAMWLEHQARGSVDAGTYAIELRDGIFDARPALRAIVADRLDGRPVAQIARGFHGAVARAVCDVAEAFDARLVVASGGVLQNALLVEMLSAALGERLWLNHAVPPNDGGLSLGQAALAWAALRGGQ